MILLGAPVSVTPISRRPGARPAARRTSRVSLAARFESEMTEVEQRLPFGLVGERPHDDEEHRQQHQYRQYCQLQQNRQPAPGVGSARSRSGTFDWRVSGGFCRPIHGGGAHAVTAAGASVRSSNSTCAASGRAVSVIVWRFLEGQHLGLYTCEVLPAL